MNKVVYEKGIDKDKEMNLIFKDYCGVALKGPTSIIGSNDDDYIIVTDAGLFGSSGVNNQNGSIYLYDIVNNVLRPIILNNLSYPCDIYHANVFYTFNGKLGPSAINMDDMGNIYVSRCDFFGKNNKDGIISIISKEGNLIGDILVEGDTEINGMLIPKNFKKEKDNNRNKNNGNGNGLNSNDTLSSNVIYFTDKNFSGVLKIKLSAISQDLEKLQENKF